MKTSYMYILMVSITRHTSHFPDLRRISCEMFVHGGVAEIRRDWLFKIRVSEAVLASEYAHRPRAETQWCQNEKRIKTEESKWINTIHVHTTHIGGYRSLQNCPSPAGCAPERTTFEMRLTTSSQTSKVELTGYSIHHPWRLEFHLFPWARRTPCRQSRRAWSRSYCTHPR